MNSHQRDAVLDGCADDGRYLTSPWRNGSGDGATEREPVMLVETRRPILSVDVFDTALTRACGPPSALWLWLARRLARQGVIDTEPETLARARQRADAQVWRREGGLDSHVCLEDFWHEVARMLDLDAGSVPRLARCEQELEAEVLRAVAPIRRMVEDAAGAGLDVVFTSDTYFSRSFVEHQLRRHGLWQPRSTCLASSEYGESKASGQLFERLQHQVAPFDRPVRHIGDNPHSDVTAPRRRGVDATWFASGRHNRYEQLLADATWSTQGFSAALAGASRLARLETPAGDEHHEAIRDVAASVAAPLLVGYVLWVLRRASRLGLSRLRFVARDGQVLCEIAATLCRRLNLPIEARYLHASRQATNLAATFDADDEELGWVVRDLGILSPSGLLARFDLDPADIPPDVPGLEAPGGSDPIPRDALPGLRHALRFGSLRDRILERAAARRRVVARYLDQEGLLDGTASGIVDFGGVGSQVRALHRLIEHEGGTPPRVFLVGLDRPEDAGLSTPSHTPRWLDDTECYLYDHRRGAGIKRGRGFGTVMQMFCAADHGTVVGYRETHDGVEPILDGETDTEVIAWGLPTLRATITTVLDHLVLDEDLLNPHADVREPTYAAVEALWGEPSPQEARAWGSFPFEGAQASGGDRSALVSRYSWWTVGRGLLDGSFPDLGWQHWYEGSLQVSPRSVRALANRLEHTYRRMENLDHPVPNRLTRFVRRTRGR